MKRLRKDEMLSRSAAEDTRRALTASPLKILAQWEGLCEAWGFKNDLKRLSEMPHGSDVRKEQLCSQER
jgi:hypothetical protein